MATALRTFEAMVSSDGQVHLLQPFALNKTVKAVVTILPDDDVDVSDSDVALLSQPSLAADWDHPEEDLAWAHLQQAQ